MIHLGEEANSLDIEFSVAAEVETPNWRTTWGHRAAISSRARLAVRNAVPDAPQWYHYTITITRIGANRLDDDNLISACKSVRDEVAQWLGVDDGSPRMQWHYEQRVERVINETPRAKRTYRTWVEIRVQGSLEPASGEGPATQPHPPGMISSAGEGGRGADIPSNYTISSCETAPTPPPGGNSANSPGPIRSSGASRVHEPRAGLVRLPPDRLEREKKRPDVPAAQGRTPLRTVAVGTRGLSVELAEAPGGRQYVRLCKHYVQQGHAWRTSGVAIELDELRALVAALVDFSCK